MAIKFPTNERVWVGYYNLNEELTHIITSKESRDYYYLYKIEGDKCVKLGKSKNPNDLEEKYRVCEWLEE